MQEMSKSVKIWQSYREYKGGNFFETQCSLVSPTGSFITGVPEVEMARATTSLMAWCLAILLARCLFAHQAVLRTARMSKNKNGGLDQYDPHFKV